MEGDGVGDADKFGNAYSGVLRADQKIRESASIKYKDQWRSMYLLCAAGYSGSVAQGLSSGNNWVHESGPKNSGL